jgi:hypothetical protein
MASNSKSGTARKAAPVKKLDYPALTDTELLRELARMYDNMLGRLNTYLEVGTGADDAAAVPEALEAGLALHAKADELVGHFRYGTSRLPRRGRHERSARNGARDH